MEWESVTRPIIGNKEAIHANIEANLNDHHNWLNENKQNTLRLLQLYNHYKSLNDPDYSDNWPDHIFMMEFYVEPLANAIWELNKYEGVIENYYWFAWTGLTYRDENDQYLSNEQLELKCDNCSYYFRYPVSKERWKLNVKSILLPTDTL